MTESPLDPDYRASREPFAGYGRSSSHGSRHTRGGRDRERAIAAEVQRCRALIEEDTRRREKRETRRARRRARKSTSD